MADGNVKVDTVTTAEAAFVVGVPQRQVHKEIDAGPIKPRKVRGRRMLDRADLVYLTAVKELAGKVKPEGRAEVCAAVKRAPGGGRSAARTGVYSLDYNGCLARVMEGMERLRRARELIDTKAKGGPVLAGTTIEVHRLAALIEGGATVEMVLEDYPSLKRPQVEAARDWAAAHPRPGRKFPSISIKRAFDRAGLDDLADILDEMAAKRRRAAR